MSSNATPGAGGFPLNIITASEFKEWEVTKVNRRGRRQQRFFGLDLSRVTNRKVIFRTNLLNMLSVQV